MRHHQIGQSRAALGLRNEKAAQVVLLCDGRRQSDAGEIGSEHEQPRQPEGEQVPPFRRNQCMQFVEHDPLQRSKKIGRIGRGQDQGKLLGRREQNLRRVAALALALRRRRVAGTCLDTDRQSHLGNRPLQVARDVDRERLEWRDVESVESAVSADAATGGDKLRRWSRPTWSLGVPPSDLRGHVLPRPWPKGSRWRVGQRRLFSRARSSAQFHQARQESRERLAGAGGCNQ